MDPDLFGSELPMSAIGAAQMVDVENGYHPDAECCRLMLQRSLADEFF